MLCRGPKPGDSRESSHVRFDVVDSPDSSLINIFVLILHAQVHVGDLFCFAADHFYSGERLGGAGFARGFSAGAGGGVRCLFLPLLCAISRRGGGKEARVSLG